MSPHVSRIAGCPRFAADAPADIPHRPGPPVTGPMPGMADREYPGGMVGVSLAVVAMVISIPGVALIAVWVGFARAWK